MNIESINFVLDIILIIMALWMIRYIVGFGGFVERAFRPIIWGALLIGISHLQESVFIYFFDINLELSEFFHRIIVLIGFALMIRGFHMLTKK